jgi:broad specificity phosphatase PhoE
MSTFMGKRILVFRHAEPRNEETEKNPNAEDCCKGDKLDCNLTLDGEDQTIGNVLYARSKIRNALTTLVLTSPSKRASRFAEVWIERHAHIEGVAENVRVHTDFRDIGVGVWEGEPWSKIQAVKEYEEALRLLEEDGEKWRVEGSEEVSHLRARVSALLQRVFTSPYSDIILVGHSATNEIILSIAQNRSKLNFRKHPIGSVAEFDLDDDGTLTVLHEPEIHYNDHKYAQAS